ncbi:MAG TPA: hypothetical protein VGI67_11030 [Thermoleophilaceae bacterium]|jgi:hypothetical protein
MSAFGPSLGVLAALMSVANTFPYVRDTLRRTTRPHRGAWLIWSVLAIVACLSQWADGGSWSLVMCAVQALLDVLVLVLAVRLGEGGVSTGEKVAMGVAAAGVLGWIAADTPMVATSCVVVADLMGAVVMAPKAYHDPDSETLATFALASLGGAVATGAVGAADPSLLLYPIYFCLVNASISLLIWHRRTVLAAPPHRPLAAAR